jgi:hypothetical protein
MSLRETGFSAGRFRFFNKPLTRERDCGIYRPPYVLKWLVLRACVVAPLDTSLAETI